MLKRELIVTEDGSSSIFIPELDEIYHSSHGAVQESNHVFIKAGLKTLKKEEIAIFEMGFGTGLNALLTLLNATNKTINYHTIEAYPVEQEMVEKLNYIDQLKLDEEQKQSFFTMHQSKYGKQVKLNNNFNFLKEQVKLKDFKTTATFDLIYFDAFAPAIQPDLWTGEVFQQMYSMVNTNGILVTYCAKGQVRRNMQAAGFKVERLPGPPYKREILRATKN